MNIRAASVYENREIIPLIDISIVPSSLTHWSSFEACSGDFLSSY